jgi:hypothetical protein
LNGKNFPDRNFPDRNWIVTKKIQNFFIQPAASEISLRYSSWDLGIDNVLEDGITDKGLECCIGKEVYLSLEKVFKTEPGSHEIIERLFPSLE